MRILKVLAITSFLMATTFSAPNGHAGDMALVRCELSQEEFTRVTAFSISSSGLIPNPALTTSRVDCAVLIKQLMDKGFSVAESHYFTDDSNLKNTVIIYRLLKK